MIIVYIYIIGIRAHFRCTRILFFLEPRVVIKLTKKAIRHKAKQGTDIAYLPADTTRQIFHDKAILGACWWSISKKGKTLILLHLNVFNKSRFVLDLTLHIYNSEYSKWKTLRDLTSFYFL